MPTLRTLLALCILAQFGPVMAIEFSASRGARVVQQDLSIKVAPLSCKLQEEEMDSLTCYIPQSQLNLPKGGHLVSVTTSAVIDKVTVKTWPRDGNYIQVQL